MGVRPAHSRSRRPRLTQPPRGCGRAKPSSQPTLRLVVSAAFFPHFSRNLNTGELEMVSAMSRKSQVRIHHDRAHPSAVTLPVIP